MNVAIVLAAGESTRMGHPKQLLTWHDRPLLFQTINELLAAGLDRIVVVLGAHADEIEHRLRGKCSDQVEFVTNPNWSSGQASSLLTGLRFLQSDATGIRHVLLALCDQPFVTADDYRSLLHTASTGSASAVATRYDSGGGVPAVFTWSACSQLLTIDGDSGARGWLRRQPSGKITLVDIPGAFHDLDNPKQYEQALIASRQNTQERNQ